MRYPVREGQGGLFENNRKDKDISAWKRKSASGTWRLSLKAEPD